MSAKLKEVYDCCSKNNWIVSPRSQRMIHNYMLAASRLMSTQSADSAYAPVDFAVAEKILPMISGSTEQVGKLVSELSTINGLPMTGEFLARMKRVGEDSGFYQFLA
jgi:hypothetical protein